MSGDEIKVTRVDPVRCNKCGKEISHEEADRHGGRCDACSGTIKVSFKGTAQAGRRADVGTCPVCGSRNISRTYVKQLQTQNQTACCVGCVLAPVIWPLLLVLPFFGKGEWRGRCGECGHEWRE